MASALCPVLPQTPSGARTVRRRDCLQQAKCVRSNRRRSPFRGEIGGFHELQRLVWLHAGAEVRLCRILGLTMAATPRLGLDRLAQRANEPRLFHPGGAGQFVFHG